LLELPRAEYLQLLMKPFGKNVFWVSRVLFNRSGQVAGFYTIAETQDRKQHLVHVNALAGGVEILPDAEDLERFFR